MLFFKVFIEVFIERWKVLLWFNVGWILSVWDIGWFWDVFSEMFLLVEWILFVILFLVMNYL